MLILGIDFESTWTEPVDPKQARITEIGAVLMDWETQTPLEILSTLIYDNNYPLSPPELVELTGITDTMLLERGKSPDKGLRNLNILMAQCDYVVAHNGLGFDKPLYLMECMRNTVAPVDKPWVDTRTDIPYKKHIKTRKLTHLAADHSFANPFAHRAIFDVLTMLKILSLYDIQQVIELSKEPLVHCIARVSFQDKDKAKARGYYWDGEKKSWFKPMKESEYLREENEAPFVCVKHYPPGV